MPKPTLIVFDFETTGLDPQDGAEPIEIAAIAVDPETLEEISRFPARIMTVKRPDLLLSDDKNGAFKVHGISRAKVIAGEAPNQVLLAFHNWAKSFIPEEELALEPRKRTRPILLGHNVKFDISFLKQMYRDYMPRGLADYDEVFDYHTRCTVEASSLWFVDVLGINTKVSLVNIAPLLNIPHEAHKAMGDVEATLEVYRYIRNHARDVVEKAKKYEALAKEGKL